MKKARWVCSILSTALVLFSCDTSIGDYQPRSEDEKKIIALLAAFVDAGNAGDLAAIQASFHDQGSYKNVRGGKITKNQIPQTDPEFWTVAGKVQLKNPKLQVSDNRAEVIVTAKHGAHFTATTVFTLTKEDNRWLIVKVE